MPTAKPSHPPLPTVDVYAEIAAERARQVTRGRDAAHDDARDYDTWMHCLWLVSGLARLGPPLTRQQWIKIASIAVAIVESDDRKNGLAA